MKTRDAFALCRLYDDLYYANGFECIPDFSFRPVGGLNFGTDEINHVYVNSREFNIEEALLKYLDDDEIKSPTTEIFSEMKQTQQNLTLTMKRIKNARKRAESIERHIVILQGYQRRMLEKILETELTEKLKARGYRAKHLIEAYEWIDKLFRDYESVLSKDWAKHNENFNRACRKEFGARLRQARIAKKISTTDMATKLGLSRVGYSYYELGQRDLPTPTIYRIAEILEVSLDWLFGLKD